MSIHLDIKDSASLGSKWFRIITKLKCSMVISSARRTMSQKKRTQISRFLKKDRSFQMTQVLIISKKRVSLKVKIQNII